MGHSGRIIPSPWGNEDTQQLIDILAKYNVKATFFVVGDWVDKYPESVKALHDAGHEVMSHSAHHDHFNALTADQIVADVKLSCDKIEAVTGARPTLFRPPYGEYDDHVITAVRSLGIEPIQWDVDGSETDSSRWGAIDSGHRHRCVDTRCFLKVCGDQIRRCTRIKATNRDSFESRLAAISFAK